MSERCEQTSERTSEWPITNVGISISSGSLCKASLRNAISLSEAASCESKSALAGVKASLMAANPASERPILAKRILIVKPAHEALSHPLEGLSQSLVHDKKIPTVFYRTLAAKRLLPCSLIY